MVSAQSATHDSTLFKGVDSIGQGRNKLMEVIVHQSVASFIISINFSVSFSTDKLFS